MTDDPLSVWDGYDPDDDEWTAEDEADYQRLLRTPEGIALALSGIEEVEAERKVQRAKRRRDDAIIAAYDGGFTPEEIAGHAKTSIEDVNFVLRNHTPSRRPTKKKGN